MDDSNSSSGSSVNVRVLRVPRIIEAIDTSLVEGPPSSSEDSSGDSTPEPSDCAIEITVSSTLAEVKVEVIYCNFNRPVTIDTSRIDQVYQEPSQDPVTRRYTTRIYSGRPQEEQEDWTFRLELEHTPHPQYRVPPNRRQEQAQHQQQEQP